MPDALRVALLARAVQPMHGVGGLERHVYDLVRQLTRRGVHVTLVTRPATLGADTRDPAELFAVERDRFHLITVPYVTFPGAGRRGTTIVDRSTAYPLFGWRAGRVAVRLARAGGVDVVHALGASGLGYAAARRQAGMVPLVFNPQGLEEFGGTRERMPAMKRLAYVPLQHAVRTCARAADVVIATDRSLVATVRRHLEVADARIATVPNAIDLDSIDAARRDARPGQARRAAGIADDEGVLLSVGRLEENKGFHVLADALGRLHARRGTRARWRWVLVGDGPYRPVIVRTAGAAAVASRMIVAGRVSDADLASWYEAADVFVHPTLYEGSSLVTLEAMAREKPVVGTRAGGLPDKIVPGETGWLVEPGDPDALADAIDQALQSADERRARGRAGRRLAEREFSWPAITERLLAIYHALGGATPGDPLPAGVQVPRAQP